MPEIVITPRFTRSGRGMLSTSSFDQIREVHADDQPHYRLMVRLSVASTFCRSAQAGMLFSREDLMRLSVSRFQMDTTRCHELCRHRSEERNRISSITVSANDHRVLVVYRRVTVLFEVYV